MIKFTSHSFNKERFYWISLIILFMILVSIVLINNVYNKNKLVDIQQREEGLLTEIKHWKKSLVQKEKLLHSELQQDKGLVSEVNRLKKLLVQKEELLQSQLQTQFSDEEINQLREKGFQDPIKDIINDLREHEELIFYKGVLGGTMHFADIYVLCSKWVCASFDNGHIDGKMLLKYSVSKRGVLSWEIIDSYLD